MPRFRHGTVSVVPATITPVTGKSIRDQLWHAADPRAMATAGDEWSALFHERARLIDLAAEHHRAGRYDASVPILLAHIEGIVIDVTEGKKYFTKRADHKADVVNPDDLAGIEACMAALQGAYGEGVPDTQAAGRLSRHGILHGRELAYDTQVNSAKTWSVMDAVVHWALPQSRVLANARRAALQAANAGSGETDEQGRRVDDREIAETRNVLRLLGTSAMGWHRQRGRFRDDLVDTVYDARDFTKHGLPSDPAIATEVNADGQTVGYWRETVSGWVLGLALTWDGEHFGEYLFAGEDSPAGVPGDPDSTWGDRFAIPPDWGG